MYCGLAGTQGKQRAWQRPDQKGRCRPLKNLDFMEAMTHSYVTRRKVPSKEALLSPYSP